jgi:hypothetical protein
MRLDRRATLTLVAILLSLFLSQTTYAAPIGGVSVTASSELFPGFDRRAIHMVDGSGLTGTAHGTVPEGFMWLSTGNACCGGAADPNPIVTFDLGGMHNVGSMKVWNYNEGTPNLTARGINTADILVAGEDSVFSPLVVGQAFTQAPGTATDFSQTIAMGDVAARYVRLANMTHFPGFDNDFFGLSEVQFDGTPIGPPPPPPHPGLSPIRARASSFFAADGRLPAHAVNGNGLLVGNAHAIGPPGGTMWLSDAGDPTGTFDIDLRGVHDITSLRIWNYNENANPTCCLGRGVRDVDVYVAGADGVFGASPVLTTTWSQAPGVANVDFSEIVGLSASQVRYIRLDIVSNHGDPAFSGLSEVKVTGTPLAGQVPWPTTIKSVSSNISGFDRQALYAVNDAGMGYGDTHSPDPTGRMWLNQGTFANVPPEQFDLNPEITFDLGSEVAINRMKVFNYNEYRPDLPLRTAELLGRGVQLADILVAGEDMVFTPLILGQEFERAPEVGDTADIGQVVDLGNVVARYVKFDILSNHNGKIFDDPLSDDLLQNFAGLSEVQFFAVPEPATYVWALVIGMIALGSRLRRGRG